MAELQILSLVFFGSVMETQPVNLLQDLFYTLHTYESNRIVIFGYLVLKALYTLPLL